MAKKSETDGFLVGVDEAGRGPLAGPVVACAVLIVNKSEELLSLPFDDSKRITSQKRKVLYDKLKKMSEVEWGIGVVSEKIIDKINIREATKLAMRKATDKIKRKKRRIVVDGNFTFNEEENQEAVKGADGFVLECMIASVIAKVERDKIMEENHTKYPLYGFYKHKGYGTKEHYAMLKKYGKSPVHRESFRLF